MNYQPHQQDNRRPNVPGLGVIDPIRWDGQPVPQRRWIVEGMIPHGAVTMLGGDGGLGKSLLTMQLLTAAATNRPWLGLGVAPCRALGVYCEDEGDELHRRMADILDANQMSFADLEDMRLVSRVGMPNEFLARDKYGKIKGPSSFYVQVIEQARDFGAQLVVLDGLHDLFDGNENSRPEARQFINMLRRIALEIDGAVILCAHPSMSGLNSGTGTSGSTAWNNAVRSRLYLTKAKDDGDGDDKDPDVRVLKSMKSNYGKTGDQIQIRWKAGVFVQDNVGLPSGAVAVLARRNAFLDALDTINGQLRPVSDKSRAGNYAPKILCTMPQVRGHGLKELERAMFDLLADGTIRMGVIGKGPDRHDLIGLRRAGGNE